MKQPHTGPRYKPPIPAIRMGSADRVDVDTRFATLLVWYMRVLALLWMGQGVLHWWALLRPDDLASDPFETVTFLGGTAIVFFCVLDLIAAVGLWLSAAWGGAVWLVAVTAQWLAVATLPGLFPSDRIIGTVDAVLVALYFILIYMAAREAEPFV